MASDYVKLSMVSQEGFKLHARYNLFRGQLPEKVVFFAPGDGAKGSHSLSWTNIPPKILSYGVGSFLFDYTGTGKSGGEREKLTLDIAKADMITALRKLKQINPNCSLGVMAASFGGTVVMSSIELLREVECISFKSPAPFLAEAYLNEYGETEFLKWKHGKSKVIPYRHAMLRSSIKHNCFDNMMGYEKPCLITHGTNDEVVPFQHSILLQATMNNADLLRFEDGNHSYSLGDHWNQMAARHVEFLVDNL